MAVPLIAAAHYDSTIFARWCQYACLSNTQSLKAHSTYHSKWQLDQFSIFCMAELHSLYMLRCVTPYRPKFASYCWGSGPPCNTRFLGSTNSILMKSAVHLLVMTMNRLTNRTNMELYTSRPLTPCVWWSLKNFYQPRSRGDNTFGSIRVCACVSVCCEPCDLWPWFLAWGWTLTFASLGL